MSEHLDQAKKHFQLGLEALGKGNFSQAEKDLRQANQLAPNRASILTNLSAILIHQENWLEAIKFCNQVLKVEPNNPDGLNNLGVCRLHINDDQDALVCFDQAVERDPSFVAAWVNKGNIFLDQGLFAQARDCFDKALQLNANSEEALNGLGNLHNELKKYSEAIEYFSKALAINPENFQARWNKALSLLRLGEFKEGWELFEARWNIPGMRQHKREFNVPLWLGKESIQNKTILIYSEQGYGDTIQFCRYIPLLESMGAKVIFIAPTSLVSLMTTLSKTVTVIADDILMPKKLDLDIDFYCPIMSLALAFETTLNSIPNQTPYLYPSKIKCNYWDQKIKDSKSRVAPFRIGIAWAGSGHYAGKKSLKRDLPISVLAEIANRLSDQKIEFHSLQVEERKNSLLASDVQSSFYFHHQDLRDFSDSASLMMSLDLIISIDTAAAHLAGALNLLTLLLIPDPPDFMAQIDRIDTPWYPNTKIIRQTSRGVWSIDQITSEIKRIIESK